MGTSAKTQLRKPVREKHFSLGLEAELFVVDQSGNIVAGADTILKKINDSTTKHTVTKECAKNIIELGSVPSPERSAVTKSFLTELQLLQNTARAQGYHVLPLGTYPGTFAPSMRTDKRYRIQVDIFGKQRFLNAGRCCGFHFHYEMPKGVFDTNKKMLKNLNDSKHQEYLVHAFNTLVALDPVLTTFMQSSPFYQGKHLAKDSRVLVYRGGVELSYDKSLYARSPNLGSLPPYVHAGANLVSRVHEHYAEWIEMLNMAGVPEKDFPQYRSILDPNWSAVKVNAHGTLEQRGMDMNRLPILLAVSALIQLILQRVQDGDIRVVPHDSGIAEPFALERKTLYIAPDTYVKKHLQPRAVAEGLSNDDVHRYCKRAVALAEQLGGKREAQALQALTEMLATKRTTSDDIIAYAKKAGHTDITDTLPKNLAQEIALMHAEQLAHDIARLI